MNLHTTAVLLAAGFSRRFGTCKSLARLPDERVMGLAALQPFRQLSIPVVVVVREHEPLQALYQGLSGVKVVVNEAAEQGMGRSLACGIQASPESDGWFIALADMPYITRTTLLQLSNALTHRRAIIAPLYRGKRGHPVLIGSDYRTELLALQQDKGAAFLFKKYPKQVVLLPCEDAGVLKDIDYPADFEQ